MKRDYSQFLPLAGAASVPRRAPTALETLGWRPFFAQQASIDDLIETPPVRVVEVHRIGLQVLGEEIDALVPSGLEATVGDWLLYDRNHPARSRLLDRTSLFKRRAPGKDRRLQLIAANVDTALIVSSCNLDFSVARLERYAALALEAKVTPVIVLTKADLTEKPSAYVAAADAISDSIAVVPLNALSEEPTSKLADWCTAGQTLALLGSSGVGKSTLVNALLGEKATKTSGIREDDDKGRHTTSRRQIHFTPQGCALIDTPGMRELQLTDSEEGVADLFSDLAAFAGQCRFRDCQHESEPGCALQAALERGEVDPARLARWRKLAAEERYNAATLAERRARDKSFGKMVRAITKHHKKRMEDW